MGVHKSAHGVSYSTIYVCTTKKWTLMVEQINASTPNPLILTHEAYTLLCVLCCQQNPHCSSLRLLGSWSPEAPPHCSTRKTTSHQTWRSPGELPAHSSVSRAGRCRCRWSFGTCCRPESRVAPWTRSEASTASMTKDVTGIRDFLHMESRSLKCWHLFLPYPLILVGHRVKMKLLSNT